MTTAEEIQEGPGGEKGEDEKKRRISNENKGHEEADTLIASGEGFLEEALKGRVQIDIWAWAGGTGKRRNKGLERIIGLTNGGLVWSP